MTGMLRATDSRNSADSGAIQGSTSVALIGPPIMPIPENREGSVGTASPASIASSVDGSDMRSSHSAKCAGPSVGLKRKIAMGRIERGARGARSLQSSMLPVEASLRSACSLVLAACLALGVAQPGAQTVEPNANLRADGIPAISAALAAKVAPYTEFRPASAVSWHPRERTLIVARRAGNTTQLHRVSHAGGDLEQLTDFAEPVRFGMWWRKA